MIKRKEAMEKEVREHMRGGSGDVEILHVFKEAELKGKARLCAHILLKPDCGIGYHVHENEEEIFYILKGQGIVKEGDQEYKVGPGDAVLTGNGAGHAIRNEHHEPLEFLAVILLYV
jgi:mannose-6-phosphate isomerase-like protein (cupin superfamily)